MRMRALLGAALVVLAAAQMPARAATPLVLTVDAREVSRKILHMQLDVPVSGGPVHLVFPKWVPGQHAPANPVVDLVLLAGSANGTPVVWHRDPVDLFAFTFDVPAGVTTLHVSYDALLANGYTTSRLALINWNPTLLYPAGSKISETPVQASLLLPAGWNDATALDGQVRTGDRLDFAPVSIERLFDSPVLAGANLVAIKLNDLAELDIASDSPAPPVVNEKVRAHFAATVDQAQLLFGSHHWRAPYHFLITATDAIGYTGLEHHESSWNGVTTTQLESEAGAKTSAGDLLTHEFTHSWNGKYRRPAGLFRDDYQADETTDLLWVYEGLTEYYSDVLAARAGFWSAAEYRAALAAKYATLDAESGRLARTLADTTFQARLSGRSGYGGALRSREEYYDESELMWLDADTLIRERSGGKASLDDFARAFYGKDGNTGPAVIPYTRADVVAALNAVLPYDWEGFFHARLDVPTAHPPQDGITRGGYTFTFAAKAETPNPSARNNGTTGYGASIAASGTVQDVALGSAAARAGLVPGMTVVAVDDRRFSLGAMNAALERAAKSKAPIALLVDEKQTYLSLQLQYDGGVKTPVLERGTGPDILDEITKPRVP